jgi:LytS/YehU family sensor histidine kinase
LVENAIKHGIAKSEEGGTIFIQTQIDNTQQLCIQIGNTGKLDISSKDANSLGFGLHATKQ